MNILKSLLSRLKPPTRVASIDATRQQPADLNRHITDTIDQALDAAGLGSGNSAASGVRDTIAQALGQAGLVERGPVVAQADSGFAAPLDAGSEATLDRSADRGSPRTAQFLRGHYSSDVGTRSYRLYVPAGASDPLLPIPLLVMLHGCTQSAEDFATGTGMNAVADQHGFAVLYPAQEARANGQRCWNWFRSEDQQRDRGEPALLAGMVREAATTHHIDAGRIFVAGLSAGGAMAVILGHAYPDLFAGVGVHSGLPYAAASDVGSAFAAMQRGPAKNARPAGGLAAGVARLPAYIVFHGDADKTVHLDNGAAVIAQAVDAHAVVAGGGGAWTHRTDQGEVAGGRGFSRAEWLDEHGIPRVEQWTVHGSGHAWSGGQAAGSYTDPRGPDASVEMARFFLLQPRLEPTQLA